MLNYLYSNKRIILKAGYTQLAAIVSANLSVGINSEFN